MTSDERRKQPLRRQVNEAFTDPDGRVAISKVLAVFAQIAVLFHFGRTFDELIARPESLAIVLTFLIAPDVFKKLLSLKYGGSEK